MGDNTVEESGKSSAKYEAVAQQDRYRKQDASIAGCRDGSLVVVCANSGKVGKQKAGKERKAAVGGTVLWLTCPALNSLVARLERNNAVKVIQDMLNADENMMQMHVAGHLSYLRVIEPLLSEEQLRFFISEYVVNATVNRRKFGNAAVGHATDMKCLHALVAAALAKAQNPVGCALVRYFCHIAPKNADQATINALVNEPMINDMKRFVEFVERQRPSCFSFDDGFDPVEEDVCGAAHKILIAVEGHDVRTKKKYRIN